MYKLLTENRIKSVTRVGYPFVRIGKVCGPSESFVISSIKPYVETDGKVWLSVYAKKGKDPNDKKVAHILYKMIEPTGAEIEFFLEGEE